MCVTHFVNLSFNEKEQTIDGRAWMKIEMDEDLKGRNSVYEAIGFALEITDMPKEDWPERVFVSKTMPEPGKPCFDVKMTYNNPTVH